MAILRLISVVDQPEFIKAIHVQPLAPSLFAQLEKYVAGQPILSSLGTIPPWIREFPSLASIDPGMVERQIVATRLRKYVDEWIETGVNPNVGELPLKRDLMKASAGAELLREYVEQHRPSLRASTRGLAFVFEVGRPAVADGSFAGRHQHDVVTRAFDEAARLFAGLMLSEWGERMCKCRHEACGKYFVKERFRTAPLVRGTFCCPEHQRTASAAACVLKSREDMKRELIGRAVAILFQWRVAGPEWQEDSKLKRQLAFRLSETPLCKRNKLVLKSNWVTRHCNSIETRRLERTRQ